MNDKLTVNAATADDSGVGHGEASAGKIAGKHVGKHPQFAITPQKLWAGFLYRWKSALFVGLVFAAAGAGIAWLTYKPKYTAIASMRMSATKPGLLPTAIEEGKFSARDADFQKTQAQLVKSRAIIGAVLAKDQIRGLTMLRDLDIPPQLWLEKELQTGFIPGTDILRIALSGEYPEEITLVVNSFRKVFSDQFVDTARQLQVDRLDTIENVMSKAAEKIRTQRQQLKNLAEIHKTGDTQVLTLRQRIALEEFSAMKKELSQIDADMRRLRAQLVVQRNELKTGDNEKLPQELIDEYLSLHPIVQKHQTEVNRVEQKIKDYSELVTSGSPRLRQMQDELTAAQAQLQKAKADSQLEVSKKIRGMLQNRRLASVELAEEKLKVLREQHTEVADQVNHLGREADKIGIGSFDIELRRAEIDEAEGTLKKLRTEKERLEIERFNTRKTVDAETDAEVPTVNQASVLKTGSIYSVLGLLLGCLAVSYLEARQHRVHQAGDIQQGLGIQTLGLLPMLAQQGASSYGRTFPSNESLAGIMFVDAVNNLCAKLLCDDRLGTHPVLMVTSASEDEGKTLIATQLAVGLARSGKRTLIVDCDFRKPRCHQQLGVVAGPGLSEVLSGQVDLTAALQSVPDSEAHILTAGQSNSSVVKALSNGKFAALLQQLREDFDCIIIDSAPTLVVSDGLLIGKHTDGVLLVVRSLVSKSPAVFAAYEQLTALKIPMLGAVVNANPGRPWGSYYSGY
jgi:capsular exopolysaccharide synthesis family protein